VTRCLEIRRLVPRFLALELPPETEREVREHLRSCEPCRDVLADREPTMRLAWALAEDTGPQDDRFAGEVLAGVHQRSLERRLSRRRSRLLAAAAATVAIVVAGTTVVRHLGEPVPRVVANAPAPGPPVIEPAFVEVEGAGVRLYQLTPTSPSPKGIQVAFIVDPRLEL
jgi:predicted anti-sigma-YlaC factor YlaD